MVYQKFSPRQKMTMTWWQNPATRHNEAIICDGSVRSGKTISMAIGFLLWITQCFDGETFAICGKTIESIRRNMIRLLPGWLEGTGIRIKERRSENLLTISGGGHENTIYLFGGRDESSAALVQGLTLAGVLFDEAALMPRSFVEQAMARCSVSGARLWFNCNPDTPGHWFYQEWIRHKRRHKVLYLHFTMEDNLSLSEAVRERYRSMFSGVFYRRFVLGEWVAAEGRVYSQFSADRHVLRGSTRGMNGQFYISIDYGTINPCSMGLWCVQQTQAIRIKEWYFDSRKAQHQMTDEEYYTALENLARGYDIRKVIVDPSAASFIECIRRHRKFSVWDADNDVLNGIRVTSALLTGGMVKIHESCTDAIREFGLYRWDEKASSDKVLKENDHAMDDIRYFCYTILAREFRWAEWKVK